MRQRHVQSIDSLMGLALGTQIKKLRLSEPKGGADCRGCGVLRIHTPLRVVSKEWDWSLPSVLELCKQHRGLNAA